MGVSCKVDGVDGVDLVDVGGVDGGGEEFNGDFFAVSG